MTPKASFWNRFTSRGRLINRWVRALQEDDPYQRLAGLRQVRTDLFRSPDRYTDLWPSFLDAYLGAGLAELLTDDDFQAVAAAAISLGKKPTQSISEEDVRFRLASCHEVRGDTVEARAEYRRIVRLSNLPEDAKEHAILAVARLDGTEEEDIQTYLEFLRRSPNPTAQPLVIGIVSRSMKVGFDSSHEAIKRAAAVAANAAGLAPLDGAMYWAQGIHALHIERNFGKARRRFARLLQEKRADRTVVIGYLAACLEEGDREAAKRILNGLRVRTENPFRGLGILIAAAEWLDNLQDDADRPLTVQGLDALDLSTLVPDMVDYVRGRLLLLDGDARGAGAVLGPLVDRRSDQPAWGYHAAWAELLLGNTAGVNNRLQASGEWAGSWAIACLVLDTGSPPNNLKIETHLNRAPEGFRSLLNWRVAVALGRPTPAVERVNTPSGPEERLEAFRTLLGYQLYTSAREAAKRSLAHPALLRLPAADREFWHGAEALFSGNDREGCRRLEVAAIRYNYSRAVLALVTHQLRSRQFDAAVPFLRRLAGRTNARVALLQAYHEAYEGANSTEAVRLRDTARNDVRAQYLLGHISLRRSQAHRRAGRMVEAKKAAIEAAGQFQMVVTGGLKPESDIARALLSCTRFLDDPTRRSDLPKTDHPSPWVQWVCALMRLTHGTASTVIEAADELSALLAKADQSIDDRIVPAIAERLAAECARSGDRGVSTHFAPAIRKLPHADQPSVQRWVRLCDALAARRGRPVESSDPENGRLALAMASARLAEGDRTKACEILSSTRPPEPEIANLCAILAGLCRGEAVATTGLLEHYTQTPKPVAQAAQLVAAAAAFAGKDAVKGYQYVQSADLQPNDPTHTVLDIERYLVGMVATLAQRGNVLDGLRNRVRAHLRKTRSGLTSARLAAVIGDVELASELWSAVASSENGTAREEHKKYLCYQASVAASQGDNASAAGFLCRAAVLAEGEQK